MACKLYLILDGTNYSILHVTDNGSHTYPLNGCSERHKLFVGQCIEKIEFSNNKLASLPPKYPIKLIFATDTLNSVLGQKGYKVLRHELSC